ncbi:MAG: hypothetical protein IPK97_05515 [Ahniella sp.]|nr:hypothetical protein [Ahniella sp.]
MQAPLRVRIVGARLGGIWGLQGFSMPIGAEPLGPWGQPMKWLSSVVLAFASWDAVAECSVSQLWEGATEHTGLAAWATDKDVSWERRYQWNSDGFRIGKYFEFFSQIKDSSLCSFQVTTLGIEDQNLIYKMDKSRSRFAPKAWTFLSEKEFVRFEDSDRACVASEFPVGFVEVQGLGHEEAMLIASKIQQDKSVLQKQVQRAQFDSYIFEVLLGEWIANPESTVISVQKATDSLAIVAIGNIQERVCRHGDLSLVVKTADGSIVHVTDAYVDGKAISELGRKFDTQ